jgi:hypothetical protein
LLDLHDGGNMEVKGLLDFHRVVKELQDLLDRGSWKSKDG